MNPLTRSAWLPALLLGALLPAATPAQTARAEADEPRAFGYTVGDLVQRRVRLELPAGQRLDPASLPAVGGRGKPLELRSVMLQGDELTLVYQVFLSPPEARTLEMPPVTLSITGGPRVEELRVDAWPVTVAPLMPPEVSPRRGLGELRPDAPAPLIDTSAARRRLAVYTGIAALLLLYLAHVYLALPWWARQRRPFGLAWRALGSLPAAPTTEQRREAWERVHGALNHTAGEVLFEPGLERFIAAHPRFERLRGELQQFFRRSRAEFFGGAAAADDGAWLRTFCRECRDVERGSA
ncbi:MAG TPA: hypothetical protein VLA16_22030 [Ideonella sp.]|nr:hypothetical protein [Ideonella sp.]